MPRVRHLAVRDLREVLRKGIEDFGACRTDVAFLCVFYPMIGILLAWVAFDRNLLPLLFPVMSGFALVGPVAAVGLYEMSRRRELGEEPAGPMPSSVVKSPSFGAILALGLMLGAVFIVWVLTAHGIYYATLGPETRPRSAASSRDTFTTGAGWTMIIVGCAVGSLFAALVLATSVVSFPLLLDRNVGLPVAVITSMRVAAANPVPIAVWGADRRRGLVLGSIPFFLGLIVVCRSSATPLGTSTAGRWSPGLTTPEALAPAAQAPYVPAGHLLMPGSVMMPAASCRRGEQEGTPMTEGLKTIIYPVRDLARAKDLYRALLGAEPVMNAAYYVQFDVGGLEIGLDPNGHAAGMTGPVGYWRVADIERGLQALLDAGAEGLQPVREARRRPPHRHRPRRRRQRHRLAPAGLTRVSSWLPAVLPYERLLR